MAWKVPLGHQKAFNSAVDRHMAAIDRPAKTVNPSANSMSQGLSAEAGNSIGNINPLTTAQGAPLGSAPQIKMSVKPRLKTGLIKHSLAKAILK